MPIAVPGYLRAGAPDAVCTAQFHASFCGYVKSGRIHIIRARLIFVPEALRTARTTAIVFPVAPPHEHMKSPPKSGDGQSILTYRDGGHPCQSALTYPGVYIQEVPSGVRTITGVATSITAFVGRAAAGPHATTRQMLTSFADYERRFGGLDVASPMSYAVRDFYLNGGTMALIVRVAA